MKKKLFSIFLILLLSAVGTKAQTPYPMPEQNLWPEHPHSARLRQVTMPTPALATGAVTFDVPLWTLKVDDLEIPFSLRYHSNGIRVEEDPYPVGYGWSFLPALRITRHVLGRPDGGRYTFIGNRTGLSYDDYYGCMVNHLQLGTYTAYDAEPDIFTVHLPGITFNTYYSDGTLVAPGHGEYRMTCGRSAGDYPGIISVTVTDPLGRIWNFSTEGKYWNSEAVSEWALTDVTLPSGRKVSFAWTDQGWHMPPSGANFSYYFLYSPYVGIDAPGSGEADVINASVCPGGSLMNLTGVTFPGGSISLAYNDNGCSTLSRMTVKGGSQAVEDISFVHGSSEDDKTMLAEVRYRDGRKYSFGYDTQRFQGSGVLDYWGFHKGGAKGGRADVPDMKFTGIGNGTKDFRIYGSDRRPDSLKMQARILKKAIWPTGGVAEWEYEPHRLPPKDFVDQEYSGKVTVTHGGTLTFGGGLRVRKVTLRKDADDKTPRTVSYIYGRNGDGLANVESYPTLSTFISDVILINNRGSFSPTQRETGRITVNLNSSHEAYRFGDPSIWYQEVTEVHAEGKTVHSFSKPYRQAVFNPGHAEKFHPVSLTGIFSDGPVETGTAVYKADASGARKVYSVMRSYSANPVEERLSGIYITRAIQSLYGLSQDPDIPGNMMNVVYAGASGIRDRIYAVFRYNISGGTYAPDSETVTEHTSTGDIIRTRKLKYVYGTGLVSEETLSDGTDTLVTAYSYPEEKVGTGTLMLKSNCRGVVTGTTSTFGGKTVRREYDYVQVHGNVFRPRWIFTSRDGGQKHQSALCSWLSDGNLSYMEDRAKVRTAWTWDGTGQYPLTRTVGGTLVSKAGWKPLVGVSSLTDPAGLVSSFEYDSGNRLSKTTEGGRTMVTYTYVINQNGNNSITTRSYTAANIAEPTIERIDGLGRTWGVFSRHSSGTTASLTEYDAMGRPFRRWAPTPVGSTSLSADAVRTAAVDA